MSQTTPIRIQRKRIKGWRMPENTVSVCRPSMWGNPFTIESEMDDAREQWSKFSLQDSQLVRNTAKQQAVEKFEKAYLNLDAFEMTNEQRVHMKNIRDRIRDLTGKNLTCFCSESPCHADVLLKYANWKQ
jgi:hypothetical protein